MTAAAPTLDLRDVRSVLEARRTALVDHLRHNMRDMRAGVETVQPDDAMDDLDTSAVLAQSGIDLSMVSLKTEILAAVDAALHRLDAGRYGICESCGEPISSRRLHALPFALRCLHCEVMKEDADHARRQGREVARRITEEPPLLGATR